MPKGKGKQRKRIRKRSWTASDVDTVSYEPRRILGRESGISAPVDGTVRDLDACFSDIEPNGIVISPYGVLAFVESDGHELLCRVDEALTDGKTSVLAPGDRVRIEKAEDGLVVRAVARRSTRLSRPSTRRGGEQVLAANIDTLVIVASVAKPPFRPGLVDRYLILAERGGVPVILCVNKTDLGDGEPEEIAIYRDMGLPLFPTSCETGAGVAELREALRGRLSVLAGHSGVGKSSLINVMDPSIEAATAEISDNTERGCHTTSSSRLYHLDGGIRVIDTPGVRQLGLWKVSPEDLNYYFTDLACHAARCRFRDCTHSHEPDCAVRHAAETGTVAESRYASYLRIRASLVEENASSPRSRQSAVRRPRRPERSTG